MTQPGAQLPKAPQGLNAPQPPGAIDGKQGTEDDAGGGDGGEPPGVVLEVVDEIHAKEAGDEGARGQAEGVDGDAGLEEHDLVALDGEARAEGVLLAAEDVDDAAGGLGQRVGRLVVRLEHVLGLLVVGGVVGPPGEPVGQVHGGEVFVGVEHLADRLAHQPRLGLDLGQPPRVFKHAVQLRRRQPGLEVQPVRARHRVVARRQQLLP